MELDQLSVAALILVLLGLALAGAALYGRWHWRHRIQTLHDQLVADPAGAREGDTAAGVVDFAELAGLPAPVQAYFRRVLVVGQRIPNRVRLRQRGQFNLANAVARPRWVPFESIQQVAANRPGFVWCARMRLAQGVGVRVVDAYVAGEGLLRAALWGWIPLARMRGRGAAAEAELMRYLAEAVWYPTALLPSQGVRWEAIDAHSARAHLTDRRINLAMIFRFNDQALIERVSVQARGRRVGKVLYPTPWVGRFWHYAECGGAQIPLCGEAAWQLPEGELVYWRGEITEIEFDDAAADTRP